MARGDQIYVMRPLLSVQGAYQHHGIDCGDGTVIHYHKGDDAVICRTSFADFSKGNPVFVKRYTVSYMPDVVVERAESRLGERRYDLLNNNCEHFANWCKTGKNESQQLIDYGLGLGPIGPIDSRRLVDEAAQGGDPIKAMELLGQALNDGAIAQTQLQTHHNQAQTEMDTWHRVAQLALKKNREDLARVALERKVEAKRRVAELQEQLDQLAEMQETLKRNSSVVKERVAT